MRTLVFVVLLAAAGPAGAQFLETFDDARVEIDQSGLRGWSFFSGDGEATINLQGTNEGFASILVDATRDRRNVWWAVVKHRVSEQMELEQLAQPGFELRVEVRIRSSHAPRRVNLHFNTQRTTDFHSHLMEYDIPVAEQWHTISMTTRDFPVQPGDTIFAQMALMDWGGGRYRVDIDYFKVDVVEAAQTGPDLGNPVPYHPGIPDPGTFSVQIKAAESAVVDLANPDANLGHWSALVEGQRRRVLTVSGSTWVVFRWDLEAFAGRSVEGGGLLELTTHSVQLDGRETKDAGLVRVVEILAGDPLWKSESLTLNELLQGDDLEEVFNPQMIVDWPVKEGMGETTWFSISWPVLQRLIDGRSLGLAAIPLGPISATFSGEGEDRPRLLFNTEP